VDLIDDDSWDGIELTRNNRSDEGRAFLDSLLSRRPAKKQEPSKAKAKRGDG